MTKLHVDINRSIAYYRTTLNGAPPKRVFLTGGSSQLPYLDLFIGDKLSLPVAYFNPLRNVTLGQSVNTGFLQDNSCFTAELVGLALRATGSCPAEVTLDAPTLAARAAKGRKQPFYFFALFAWITLFVCMGLWYWMQIVIAQDTADKDKSQVSQLQPLTPKITKLAAENDARNGLFKTVSGLGAQRDAWAQILDTLNQKMPKGVWITEMIPSWVDAGGAPAHPGAQPTAATSGQVNMLEISGLYHSNNQTQVISPNDIRNFVVALADSPLFDIDKNNLTVTLPSIGTSDNSVFAQRFSMHLKLKTPITLRPEVEKAAASSSPRPSPMNRFKVQLSKFDVGMIIAFAVVGLLGGTTAWWFLSGQLQTAQAACAQVAGDYNTYATAKGSGIIASARPMPRPASSQQRRCTARAQLDPVMSTYLLAKGNDLSTVRAMDPVAWKHELDDNVKTLVRPRPRGIPSPCRSNVPTSASPATWTESLGASPPLPPS